jgi:hypothetical protein
LGAGTAYVRTRRFFSWRKRFDLFSEIKEYLAHRKPDEPETFAEFDAQRGMNNSPGYMASS